MKKLFLLLSIILVTGALILLGFYYSNTRSTAAAIAQVTALPEVQEYLRTVGGGLVTLDHYDQPTNSYLIHVYEIKDGHTATFNWYTVNKDTGALTAEF